MVSPLNRIFGMGDKNESVPEEETYHPDEVTELPVEKIKPNRFQPRAVFNEEKSRNLPRQYIHTG